MSWLRKTRAERQRLEQERLREEQERNRAIEKQERLWQIEQAAAEAERRRVTQPLRDGWRKLQVEQLIRDVRDNLWPDHYVSVDEQFETQPYHVKGTVERQEKRWTFKSPDQGDESWTETIVVFSLAVYLDRIVVDSKEEWPIEEVHNRMALEQRLDTYLSGKVR